jgi:lipoprotein-releasing system permease protein
MGARFTSLKLSLSIARVHLFSKPKQTIIAMLGVTFGIGMFIALIGLMTGLNDFTEEITMTSSPDIHIYHDITEKRVSILEAVNPQGINVVHHQKPKMKRLNFAEQHAWWKCFGRMHVFTVWHP